MELRKQTGRPPRDPVQYQADEGCTRRTQCTCSDRQFVDASGPEPVTTNAPSVTCASTAGSVASSKGGESRMTVAPVRTRSRISSAIRAAPTTSLGFGGSGPEVSTRSGRLSRHERRASSKLTSPAENGGEADFRRQPEQIGNARIPKVRVDQYHVAPRPGRERWPIGRGGGLALSCDRARDDKRPHGIVKGKRPDVGAQLPEGFCYGEPGRA